MYGDVVLGVPHHSFEELLSELKEKKGVTEDTKLDGDDLKQLVAQYKQLVQQKTGTPFPEKPEVQLWGAIEAVFRSWNIERAVAYRRVHRISDDIGTAVSVVSMCYGNMGDDSGTGVAFTRDPSTGEKKFFGEFLINAQGEDVVAGIRTPISIDQMATALPQAYQQLLVVQQILENHYREMQDLEFTVERGRSRVACGSAAARPAAASPARSEGRNRRPRNWPAGVAGCGVRADRV
jgi:pyruvate,orthophosphate dikinase